MPFHIQHCTLIASPASVVPRAASAIEPTGRGPHNEGSSEEGGHPCFERVSWPRRSPSSTCGRCWPSFCRSFVELPEEKEGEWVRMINQQTFTIYSIHRYKQASRWTKCNTGNLNSNWTCCRHFQKPVNVSLWHSRCAFIQGMLQIMDAWLNMQRKQHKNFRLNLQHGFTSRVDIWWNVSRSSTPSSTVRT